MPLIRREIGYVLRPELYLAEGNFGFCSNFSERKTQEGNNVWGTHLTTGALSLQLQIQILVRCHEKLYRIVDVAEI